MEKPSSLFKPGVTIELTDVNQLSSFEDMVASAVVPDATEMQWARWEGRVALKDIIRPTGTINNIEITAFENPYEVLYSATENGWKGRQLSLVVGRQHLVNEESREIREKSCKGFSVVADAKSTGRGKIGEIQMALWYMDGREFGFGGSQYRAPRNLGGSAVFRVLSDPKIETENFIRVNEESSRIAFDVIRSAMKRPLRIGMHN